MVRNIAILGLHRVFSFFFAMVFAITLLTPAAAEQQEIDCPCNFYGQHAPLSPLQEFPFLLCEINENEDQIILIKQIDPILFMDIRLIWTVSYGDQACVALYGAPMEKPSVNWAQDLTDDELDACWAIVEETCTSILGSLPFTAASEFDPNYDWQTDNEPEPIEAFEETGDTDYNGELSDQEAMGLHACYQKLVMNCYQIHEEVRVRTNLPGDLGDMNTYMIKAYYAAEKDFILACLGENP